VIVDLHSDLLLDVESRRLRGERDVFRRHHLPEMRAAGIRVQVLAIFIETAFIPEGALRRALRLVDSAYREEQESEGALRIARTRTELDEALAAGAVAGVLSFEGVEPLGRDPSLIRVFERLGVRLVGPTWNRANAFADGAGEDRGAGITPIGRALLAELEDAGMGLDIAHLAPRAVEDALGFGGTVIASHANASAVYPNARNLDDDVLRALGERDGVCGLNFLRVFLGPGDPAERLAAHADHIAAVAGPHVPALGADFTHFLPHSTPEAPGLGLPPGTDRSLMDLPHLDRATSYGELAARINEDERDGLLFANALRVLRRILA
jgi:membrane dipeptidase